MQRQDFVYDLPSELIAQRPLERRSASRMLYLDGASGAIRDLWFTDLPDLLNPSDLLVFNDARVLPARLLGRKETGGHVEVLIEQILGERRALAHIRASRAPCSGARLRLEEAITVEVAGREGDLFIIEVQGQRDLVELLEAHGRMPLPPYIDRPDDAGDRERYQTVYARRSGAVAAPTAGLHFDPDLLARLREQGVEQAFVTLYVGAGTFQPVRVDDLEAHRMHAERVRVAAEVCEAAAACRRRGGRVVAVGTTTLRSLEAAAASGELAPLEGETDLFISPGYRFRTVDALITNFHLPESTLLMLVAAFGGYEAVMAAYRHAVEQGYRFYSYGDAMYLTVDPAARA